MMIYDVAMVEDRGSYWLVNGITQNNLYAADSEQKYLNCSAVASKLIQEAILAGNEVRVLKPLRSKEIMPFELNVVKLNADDLDMFKNSQIKRVRQLINPEIASLSGLTLYGFMCLNNELADKGYFITDTNRESKYLSILETGNEELIGKLEEYLNYKDEVSRVASLHKKFEQFRESVKDEADKEKIQKYADDFMEYFYARF